MKRFIKSRASEIFDHMSYSMDGPEPSIAVSGTHDDFFKSAFGIWIGRKIFIWMLQTNEDAQSMKGSRTKSE